MAVVRKKIPEYGIPAGPEEGVGIGVPRIPYDQTQEGLPDDGSMGPPPDMGQFVGPEGMPQAGGMPQEMPPAGGEMPMMGDQVGAEPNTDMMSDQDIAGLAESGGGDLSAAADTGDPQAQAEIAMAARRRLLGLMGGGVV